MKKRLFALLLALTMALALYVPVQAVEDTAICKTLGYDSVEAMLAKTGLTRAQYNEAFSSLKEMDAEEFYDLQLGLTNDINKASYCAFWNLSEQQFAEQMAAWAFANYCKVQGWADISVWSDSEQEAWDALLRERTLRAYGGVPGQINILLGDHCITFPDAVPEGRNGRTMVPLRAAMEAMGTLVDYDPVTRSAVVKSDKISFTHVIGTKDIVLADGSTRVMDVASYAENGRTMVPLRFFSEVLGYDVQWDNDYRMAYLLDRETMVSALDGNLKKLNRWIEKYNAARVADEGKTYQSTEKLNADIKLYDELGRSSKKRLELLVSEKSSIHGMSLSLSGEMKPLSELLAMLPEGTVEEKYQNIFDDFDLELIVNAKEGKLYLGGQTVNTLAEQAENTWLRYPVTLVAAEQGKSSTVGEMVYDMMIAVAETNYFQRTYSSVWETAVTYLSLFGDDRATDSVEASGYSWNLSEHSVPYALGQRSRDYDAGDYDALFATAGLAHSYLHIDLYDDGSVDYHGSYYYPVSDNEVLVISLRGNVKAASSFMKITANYDGEQLLNVSYGAKVTASDGAAEFALPAGANIVDKK